MRLGNTPKRSRVELHIDRLVVHDSAPVSETRLIEGFHSAWTDLESTPQPRHIELASARAEASLDGPESIGSEVARAVQGVLKP